MDQNDIDIEGGQKPYRRVFREECIDKVKCFSLACRHCADPACAAACPFGCFVKDAETGLVLYDNTDCIGCHACEAACPFNAVSFRKNSDGSEKAEKCDGCYARVLSGMEPPCTLNCPTGALRKR
jgi:Fe-S-cluster-containing dehydrogenase component